jgi:hypothetical protein
LKCFSCGGDHYINNCPEYLEFKKMREEEKQAAAMWHVTTFMTWFKVGSYDTYLWY